MASSGSECLKIVDSGENPDLIFMDIVMGEMDGFKTCRLLTKGDNSKNIPVVMISSNNQKWIDYGHINRELELLSQSLIQQVKF